LIQFEKNYVIKRKHKHFEKIVNLFSQYSLIHKARTEDLGFEICLFFNLVNSVYYTNESETEHHTFYLIINNST